MSIAMLLEMASAAQGDRLAVGSRSGNGLTYERLAAVSAGGARLVADSGADRVAYVGVNGPAFPVLLFAAARAGRPISPLNYRLSADQLREQLADLGAPYVVVDPAYRSAVEGAGCTVVSSDEWLAAAATAEPLEQVAVDDDATAVLLFTSGTTAKPKRVVLRHSNLLSYVLQTVDFASAEPDDAILVSVPPYHIAGVGTVLSNLHAGRRLAYLPNFSAAGWLDTVRSEGITHAMLVPTMLVRIVEELGGRDAGIPHLRSLAYGGARMPGHVLEAALEAFPQTGFVNAYGLTETSSTIAVLGPEDHRTAVASDDPDVRARLRSAGRAVPGIEFQVRNEIGEEVEPGSEGELWVRGPQVSGEYEGLGSVLDAEGWFPTRDRARVDAEGYLYLSGRSDDVIIRGGENIAPAEIEEVLGRHPQVRDAAVFGAPDEEWGEKIVAAVVPEVGAILTVEDVRGYVRERLRGSRTPDEVVFRDELPYTPTGKLLRRQLVAESAAAPA
ncbi:class I adenylate-forming enzyme family protein [Trujillonella humicola]|uniref:class I adenylate-forming enzyme family protein n=1 Tax=Trujillonella humicola TaxID=3383699 RepID=UPI003906B39D